METDVKKLQQLINSGIEKNIELAITLAQSNNLDLKLEHYDQLYDWWKSNSPQKSKALFRMQRILEMMDCTHLYCANRHLLEISDHIGLFPNVVFANLAYNALSAIPENLGNLVGLTQLFLSHNRLTAIPESIGQLKNLTHLNLNRNYIESLPDSIGNLVNLKRFDLSNNRLKTLPDSIQNLTKLEEITLYANKFSKEENKKIRRLLPHCAIRFN